MPSSRSVVLSFSCTSSVEDLVLLSHLQLASNYPFETVFILISQLKLDRRFGAWGKGTGKARRPPKWRESSAPHKGKRENGGNDFWIGIPLGNETARTRARTKRNDFPDGLTPNLRFNYISISTLINHAPFVVPLNIGDL